ncbi:hypothetical protein pEaSNUABM57_00040 [Erwinia phage pEa_SNUABM_57]|uniref:Uncharacterized protein n=1 Tax=Erwinia phage pEa_SNUABM_57 TaxID=2996118 RepID=A0A9E8YW17_9CAUD|nr:hypothetical protein pEaSNUABM57_00040 [Erwinia phage pEa_SNUABM_57]
MDAFTYLALILCVFFVAAIVYGVIIIDDIRHLLEENKKSS